MKVDISKLVVNQSGSVEITVDNIEDFWVLANIIREGDRIRSQIRRKHIKVNATGKTDTQMKLEYATVRITELDYQAGVDEMMLRGTLTHDIGKDVKEGSSQRILISMARPFTLIKDCWDQFTYDSIKEAADPSSNANVCAVIMQSGLAHVCVIGRNTTVVKEKVTKSIPKIKNSGSAAKGAEAKSKFFNLTAQALIKRVNLDDMKAIIIASPGFLQQEFLQYLTDNASKLNILSAFQQNKFITAKTASGFPQDLEPVLASPEMQNVVGQLKAAQQAKAIEELMRTLNNSPDMVMLNPPRVIECCETNNVEKLMVADTYIHSLPLNERLRFLTMKQKLEESGVEVVVFSSRHQSGGQLKELGGIAAILRYPVEVVDSEPDEPFD